MADGLSFESFADRIGVHKDTLYDWARKHTEFSDAKKEATAISQLLWEKTGLDAMAWKIPGFSAAIWIFNMKNRFGWRDKQPDEEEKMGSSPLNGIPAAELLETYREVGPRNPMPKAPTPKRNPQ